MEYIINQVRLCGTLDSAPVFSHENHGQRFYKFPLRVDRLSGQADHPVVVVGEGQMDLKTAVDILRKNNYQEYVCFEWEKLWHPQIAEPEIACPQFMDSVGGLFSDSNH